jgi:hypothetical protein
MIRFLSEMARRFSNWLNAPPPAPASGRRWPPTCEACDRLQFYGPSGGELWCRTFGHVRQWPPPTPEKLAREEAMREARRQQRRRW